jgi:hypothetical protein
MAADSETQPPQVAIIEPGRHGARLRISGPPGPADEAVAEDVAPKKRPRVEAVSTDEPEAEAPHPLLRFTTEDLRVELARRQRQVEYLRLQHGALLRQLAELEAQIGRLSPSGRPPIAGAAGATRGTRRAPPSGNTMSLADALAQAIPVGETITPAQAAERAIEAGYKSNAQRFGVLVATALAKDERFERLGRGRYRRTR